MLSSGTVRAQGIPGRRFSFAAGPRLFVLLCVGLVFVPLMFLSLAFGWLMLSWNLLVLALFVMDLRRLPSPSRIAAERMCPEMLSQLQPAEIVLRLAGDVSQPLFCELIDDAPPELMLLPPRLTLWLERRVEAEVRYAVQPTQRGDSRFGQLFLRYEGPWHIAQRWATFPLMQTVRVYPSLCDSGKQEALLLRSRQIELQRRMVRLRGQGREFESLREFQNGDERRDICWTATARRNHLVSTLRQSERSQIVWTVLDCGRLMRARLDGRSRLDYGTESAMRLAQLAAYGGDSTALLGYGMAVQQLRLPGRGTQHLRAMFDELALLKEETAEGNHMRAAATLLTHQKRRAMIVWITDIADLAITPDVVNAALQASSRHLVVLAVLGQPDVVRLVQQAPVGDEQTFLYAAASETLHRREIVLARLRSRGVHVIEANAPQLTGAVMNKYLEVKQKGLI